jgi:hypothetical protein
MLALQEVAARLGVHPLKADFASAVQTENGYWRIPLKNMPDIDTANCQYALNYQIR